VVLLLQDVADASRAVSETRSRNQKRDRIAALLERAAPPEVPVVVAYLSGELTQGRIGLGSAFVRASRAPPAAAPSLQLLDVERAFTDLATLAGAGSQALRRERFERLLARATTEEQGFLVRLVIGELRQGALEGVMVEAVARAARVPVA